MLPEDREQQIDEVLNDSLRVQLADMNNGGAEPPDERVDDGDAAVPGNAARRDVIATHDGTMRRGRLTTRGDVGASDDPATLGGATARRGAAILGGTAARGGAIASGRYMVRGGAVTRGVTTTRGGAMARATVGRRRRPRGRELREHEDEVVLPRLRNRATLRGPNRFSKYRVIILA